MADVRVAVFGAGEFGEIHARVLQASPGVRCVAVVDPDSSRADLVAHKHGVDRTFVAAGDAIEWGQFDAVCVVTPAETHASMAELLADRGVCMLIEKPVLQTAADADRLRKVAERVPVLPGHILRFADPYLELKRCVQAGEIGEVKWISARRYRGRDHAYRFTQSHIAHTTMIHDIDLCIWLSGTSTAQLRSAATMHVLGLPNADQVSALMEASTGATWSLQASWLITEPGFAGDRIEVFGTDGVVAVDTTTGFDLDAALAREHRELARTVRSGLPSEVITLDEAIASIELADVIAAVSERFVPAGGATP